MRCVISSSRRSCQVELLLRAGSPPSSQPGRICGPRLPRFFHEPPTGAVAQVAMCLRAEEGERIADKTVLKMMGEMGLRCGIRRETKYHRYNSYKGDVGQSFDNIIGRDFKADGPWQKLGTDVTEFKLSFGKAYLAPVYDFASKEIVLTPSRCVPTSPSNKRCSRCSWMPSPQELSRSCTRAWDGNTSTRPTSVRSPITVSSRACLAKATASTTRHRAGVRPPQGRVLSRPGLADLRELQSRPRAYITHWNTTRRQVKPQGPEPRTELTGE